MSARALGILSALPDHPLLDRLVRGRAWIAVLGVMLVGIVAMQVEVLKLGASMGRAIDRTTTLQARNESLRQSVAALADDQRIERLAAKQGMVMPAPADVGFLASGSSNAPRAIASIHQPSPASFMALSTLNGAVTVGAPPNAGSGTSSVSNSSASLAASTGSAGPSTPSSSSGTGSTTAGAGSALAGSVAPSSTGG